MKGYMAATRFGSTGRHATQQQSHYSHDYSRAEGTAAQTLYGPPFTPYVPNKFGVPSVCFGQ
jgi:hypothetical protein